MNKLSLKSKTIINFVMFLYILSIYLFTFRQGLNVISNVLAIGLIGTIWINFLVNRRKFVLNYFFIAYLLFIILCLVSSFYAINQVAAIKKVVTLVQIYALMFSLVNYIDSFEKLTTFMKCFVYSGFISSIYILLTSDFSQVSRFGEELGNVNAIGMIIGISTVFCFYFILEERKYLYIPILLIDIVVILLTGSRKSLLFILLTIIILLVSKEGNGIGGKFKAVLGSIIVVTLGLYLIYNVPLFYEIMGSRVENLLSFVFGNGTPEGSVNTRADMIEAGINWFKDNPFIGYGIDNYRFLYGGLTGWTTYSHNNFIELLVGIGLIGFSLYYLSSVLVLGSLKKASKLKYKMLSYSFAAIIIGYIVLSVGMVYYYDKHINILLAVGSAVYRIAKIDNKHLNA
ncbi:hypothetical protein ABD68_24320 [Bacillus endophyticus]|uniref:O-antigen ligase family protein n=1 Tax=Priestia endophytica TaxID=135735 RepID=UPI0018CF6F3A|nr:O-antigen ligase family protein [Priestia endophytica]MBG9814564.1 hypothetical protein [Priestia endophytica]